ncbi:MAG: DNA-processing protein DprA [Rhodothermia bacterium]|nr:DNA-processing protein DprA [Rhodothermia bacterium]
MNESRLEDKKNRLSWILALEGLDGIGRIQTQRLVNTFPTYEDLLNMPYEQALVRMKGVAKKENLLQRLRDKSYFTPLLHAAQEQITALQRIRVEVISWLDPNWPAGLPINQSPPKPNLLYGYGNIALLKEPSFAIFGRTGIDPSAFERTQSAVRHLLAHHKMILGGLNTGFDTVVHKICAEAGRPSIMWASSGLSRVKTEIRTQAMNSVRLGGLMVSSFPMQHGHQEHDEFERAKWMASIAQCCIFADVKENSPEYHAMNLAISLEKPVFGIGNTFPTGVQPISSEQDFVWLTVS